jgi:hypothetical protein
LIRKGIVLQLIFQVPFEIRFSFHGDCSFSIFTPGIFSKSRMLTVATV